MGGDCWFCWPCFKMNKATFLIDVKVGNVFPKFVLYFFFRKRMNSEKPPETLSYVKVLILCYEISRLLSNSDSRMENVTRFVQSWEKWGSINWINMLNYSFMKLVWWVSWKIGQIGRFVIVNVIIIAFFFFFLFPFFFFEIWWCSSLDRCGDLVNLTWNWSVAGQTRLTSSPYGNTESVLIRHQLAIIER